MPLLFSYGTLQQENVQLSTFGRLLDGEHDALVGFAQTLVEIQDPHVLSVSGKSHHPNLIATERDVDRVNGMVFEITDGELASADHYERLGGYKRIVANLASGKQAWVYVKATSP